MTLEREYEYHKTFLKLAKEISNLSHAQRKKVGCIIVKDMSIISFGFNGTPAGFDNCCEYEEFGILKTKKEVLHAESNAISKIAKSTYSCKDADLYITLSPCFECAKLIIQTGIKRIFYLEDYRDLSSIELLEKANVKIIKLGE